MTLAFDIPTLTTPRLTLRAPREGDFPAMLAFNNSPRSAFIGHGTPRKWVWRGLLGMIDIADTRSEALALRLGAQRETTVTTAEETCHIYRHPGPGGA